MIEDLNIIDELEAKRDDLFNLILIKQRDVDRMKEELEKKIVRLSRIKTNSRDYKTLSLRIEKNRIKYIKSSNEVDTLILNLYMLDEEINKRKKEDNIRALRSDIVRID